MHLDKRVLLPLLAGFSFGCNRSAPPSELEHSSMSRDGLSITQHGVPFSKFTTGAYIVPGPQDDPVTPAAFFDSVHLIKKIKDNKPGSKDGILFTPSETPLAKIINYVNSQSRYYEITAKLQASTKDGFCLRTVKDSNGMDTSDFFLAGPKDEKILLLIEIDSDSKNPMLVPAGPVIYPKMNNSKPLVIFNGGGIFGVAPKDYKYPNVPVYIVRDSSVTVN